MEVMVEKGRIKMSTNGTIVKRNVLCILGMFAFINLSDIVVNFNYMDLMCFVLMIFYMIKYCHIKKKV